ncbi:MAG: hypothetical protein R3275_09580 [Saprospiraceae bacterium]|nr:hypothetical protein [Saprospiraceae bacterium]
MDYGGWKMEEGGLCPANPSYNFATTLHGFIARGKATLYKEGGEGG